MPEVNVEILRWITIAYFSGAFILAIFNFNLYLLQKKLYLKKWLYFWLTVSLAYIVLFQAFYINKPFLFGIFSLLIVSASYLFLKAGSIFLKFKIPNYLIYIIGLLYLFILFTIIIPELIALSIIVAYLTYSVFTFIVGSKFIKKTDFYSELNGYIIIAFSIVSFLYIFIGNYQWFIPWGYMVFGMLGLFMGMSLIQVHFQSQKQEFILMQKKLKYLVHHDPLTKIYNRSFIDDEFANINKKNITNVGLLFIDLNNFKQINDELGHRKGDDILVKVSNVLKDIVKNNGYVCRFGGDEFIIILYNTTIKATNKLKTEITNYGNHNKIDKMEIKFAVGSAFREKSNQDIHDLLDKAEKAMYLNKDKQKV
ncbi:MAG: GGDEF domain-containing protein [Bacillota bacterium]